MNTTGSIVMSMGVTFISIGLPLLALLRYLSIPEDKKHLIAQGIKVIAITWVVAGLMICLLAIVGRFILKSF